MLVHRNLHRPELDRAAWVTPRGRSPSFVAAVAPRALRAAMGAVPVAVLCWVMLWSGPASAFCRTTTCAEKTPPAECTRDADGCWTAGIPLFWKQQCVSFSVSGLGSPRLGLDYEAAEAVVQSSFALWVNASCADGFPSIAVTSRGPLMCERREFNPHGPNANAVLFRDDEWTHDPSAIALTTVSFNPTTGELLNADMEINSVTYDQLSPEELAHVITHEAGHFLGLDHSPDPTAVMYYRSSYDPSQPVQLAPDDLDGLCAAYPPSREVPACDFEPFDGYAPDCGGDVTAACALGPQPTPTGAQAILSAGLTLLLVGLARHRLRRRG